MRLFRSLLPLAALVAAVAAPAAASAADPVDRTPGVLSVSPAHGPATGGNTVNVSTRFSQGGVAFDGKPAANAGPITVGDDFENGIAYYTYRVSVPPGIAGKKVEVTVAGVGGVSDTSNDYRYDGPKEPLAWQCGATFTADVKSIPASLTIGGQPTTVTAVDADTITFPAPSPAFAAGPDYGVYTASLGTIGSYRNGCFSPSAKAGDRSEGIAQVLGGTPRGPVAGGQLLVVKAFGDLSPTAKLYVGDEPVTGGMIASNGVYCIPEDPDPCEQPQPGELGWLVGGTTPPGTAGFVDLSIRDGNRVIWGQTASSNDYEYVAPAAIESVTPAKGPLAGGNSVEVLIGGDWVRDAQVSVGGKAATSVTQQFSTGVYDGNFGKQRLTVQLPAGASAGTVDVAATGTSSLVPGPVEAKGATATADDYTYEATSAAGPVIGGFTGGPAIANLGGVIAIRGSNLGGLRSVKIGTRSATVLIATATQIYAFVPPLTRGTYAVSVTTTKGTATAATLLAYRPLF